MSSLAAIVLVALSHRSRGWMSIRRDVARPCQLRVRMTAGVPAEATSPPKRVVMKFGGSSLASVERLREVASIVASVVAESGRYPAVVVSAMGKTTNLINAASERAADEGTVEINDLRQLHLETLEALEAPASVGMEVRSLLRDLEAVLDGVSMVRELTPRTADLLASFGERMSSRLLASALDGIGVAASAYDAWTLGLRTKGDFGEAVVDECSYGAIASALAEPLVEVPVITGYIGHDADGRVTTLGRGGSDLTATAVAAAAGFDEVQVWKDVDGMMSADPRVVATAEPVPFVTYDEAAELAFFGAQVLHPISMQPARKASIPVRVKNSYNPSHPGSLIAATKPACPQLVTAITSKRRITIVDIVSTRMLGSHGFLARVFDVFAKNKISVDVVATSEVSISLTLDKHQHLTEAVIAELSQVAQVDVKTDRAIVSFVADCQRSTELIAASFSILARNDLQVEMISQGASKASIALVVADEQAHAAVSFLHDCFFGASEVTQQPENLVQHDDARQAA